MDTEEPVTASVQRPIPDARRRLPSHRPPPTRTFRADLPAEPTVPVVAISLTTFRGTT